MREEAPKEQQLGFGFETIHDALCLDRTAPEKNQELRQNLVQVGEEEFVNPQGDIYVPAMRRQIDIDKNSEQKYVLREKKDVPDDVRREMAHLKEKFADLTWVNLYLKAKRNLAWTPSPVGTTYYNEPENLK